MVGGAIKEKEERYAEDGGDELMVWSTSSAGVRRNLRGTYLFMLSFFHLSKRILFSR